MTDLQQSGRSCPLAARPCRLCLYRYLCTRVAGRRPPTARPSWQRPCCCVRRLGLQAGVASRWALSSMHDSGAILALLRPWPLPPRPPLRRGRPLVSRSARCCAARSPTAGPPAEHRLLVFHGPTRPAPWRRPQRAAVPPPPPQRPASARAAPAPRACCCLCGQECGRRRNLAARAALVDRGVRAMARR